MVKTPLTGVDCSTCVTLNFPELAAHAIISCNINVPSHPISGIFRFRNGNILIPEPLYCPKWFTVQYFEKPGKVQREETTHFEVLGGGWHFQADEVARCVRDGKLESSVWGHDKTLLEMEIFDEVNARVHYDTTSAFLTVTNRSAARVGIGSLKRLYKFEGKNLKRSI